MNITVSASILSADMLHLGAELKRLERAGIDMLHFDVMDGVFVPNISFGLPVLQAISAASDLCMDVHLMITDPCRYVRDFAKAGADWITFHLESSSDPARTIDEIRNAGCRAGISLKPATPAAALLPYLDKLDSILVMTVEPGFGGQGYLHDMTQKIREVRHMVGDRDIRVAVDGGIDADTCTIAADAGADLLVAGSYLFRSDDLQAAAARLRNAGGTV